jgi:hypothetical protein
LGALLTIASIGGGLCAGLSAFEPDVLRIYGPLLCAPGYARSETLVTVTEDDDGTGYDFTLLCVDASGAKTDVPALALISAVAGTFACPTAAVAGFVLAATALRRALR